MRCSVRWGWHERPEQAMYRPGVAHRDTPITGDCEHWTQSVPSVQGAQVKRAPTALAYGTLIIVAWAVLHPLVRFDADIQATTGGHLYPFETAAMAWDLWMVRWLPLLLTPGILAPTLVAVRWTVAPDRTPEVLIPASAATDRIWGWVAWVMASVAVGSLALVLRGPALPLHLFGVVAAPVFASSWSSAAALHYALKLQRQRERLQQSRVKSAYLAAAAAVLSALFLAVPVGVAIPMWVAWSARRDSTRERASKGGAAERHEPALPPGATGSSEDA